MAWIRNFNERGIMNSDIGEGGGQPEGVWENLLKFWFLKIGKL